jgi:hypothetical protein
VSPVVQGVITSLTALMVTIVGLFGDADEPSEVAAKEETEKESDKPNWKSAYFARVRAVVVAWLIAGIVIGAVSGILTRTWNLLGRADSAIVAEWTSYGMKKEEVAAKLFDFRFSTSSGSDDKKPASDGKDSKDKEKDKLSSIRISQNTSALIAGEYTGEWKTRLCIELKLVNEAMDEESKKFHIGRVKNLMVNECPDDATKKRSALAEKDIPLLLFYAEAICTR